MGIEVTLVKWGRLWRETGGTAAGTRLPLVPQVPREQWEHAVILGLERELGKVWG